MLPGRPCPNGFPAAFNDSDVDSDIFVLCLLLYTLSLPHHPTSPSDIPLSVLSPSSHLGVGAFRDQLASCPF